tara:strand:- start:6018 stop:6302 length:285 start_codon:yes stop_codon:yes gene_type:complete
MFDIVNIVIFVFLSLIINHLLSNKENFECDVNLHDLETCFKRTQQQNSLKINEAKSKKKNIMKLINQLKDNSLKNEVLITQNRKGVVGLQQNPK